MFSLKKTAKSLLSPVLLAALLSAAFAQEQDNSRRFWPPNYRPAAPPTSSKPQPASQPKVAKYKKVTPAPTKSTAPDTTLASVGPEPSGQTSIGVTLWRLRAPKAEEEKAQDGARILVTKNGKKSGWVPERVASGTTFSEGQWVRLSIEVPRSGYLYVIDREQYADGTLSDPYLVFPLDPSSGENKVEAGRVIELPGQAEEQVYFELKSFGEGRKSPQVAELLTLIVAPEPLKGLPRATSGDEPPKLTRAQIEAWEKQWGAPAEILEDENGAGAVYSKAEQAAGATTNGRLTQEDPLPQTIIRVAAKPGSPFLVKLPLKIGKP